MSIRINRQSEFNEGLWFWLLVQPQMQSGGGSILRDLCGKFDGTLEASMTADDWIGAGGRPGGYGAIAFDGSDDFIDLSQITPAIGTNDFTFACWTRTTDSTLEVLFAADNTTWWLGKHGDGRLRTSITVPADNNLDNGLWHHVGVSRFGGNEYLYLDGIQIGTAANTLDLSLTAYGIGRFSVSGFYWNGDFDDARLYGRGLSESQMYALNEESKASYPNAINWDEDIAAMVPVIGGVTGSPFQHRQRQFAA